MSKAFFLVVLLGLVAAASAEFAEPPQVHHKPPRKHLAPAQAPRPHWPFHHEHKPGPGPRSGPFAHPPRTADGPDHMPRHHHRHGHHFPGGALPPMMWHSHGPHGKMMPPAHAPHMHPRHHMPPHEPLAPAY